MEDDDFDPNAIPDLVPLAADKPADSVSAAFTAGADETKTPGAARKEPTRRPPVPLTILTGWLGSGKTSLLHWLLGELGHQGKTVAILQNETSEVMGVEAALRIRNEEGVFAEVLEIGNGCVCCSVRSDMLLAIDQLLSQRSFDYVVVECSGIADPGSLVTALWVDAELESRVFLDGVVAVVDASTLQTHLSLALPHSQLIISQIAFADLVLLNKVDLIANGGDAAAAAAVPVAVGGPGEAAGTSVVRERASSSPLTSSPSTSSLLSSIRAFNATSAVLPVVRSRAPLDRVLDMRAFDGARTADDVAATVTRVRAAAFAAISGASGAPADACCTLHHGHDGSNSSCSDGACGETHAHHAHACDAGEGACEGACDHRYSHTHDHEAPAAASATALTQPHGISTVVIEFIAPPIGAQPNPAAVAGAGAGLGTAGPIAITGGFDLVALKHFFDRLLWEREQRSLEIERAKRFAAPDAAAPVDEADPAVASAAAAAYKAHAAAAREQGEMVLFRMKGVLAVGEGPAKHYLQSVMSTFDISEATSPQHEAAAAASASSADASTTSLPLSVRRSDVWEAGRPRLSRIVAIGLNLQPQVLIDGLLHCVGTTPGSSSLSSPARMSDEGS